MKHRKLKLKLTGDGMRGTRVAAPLLRDLLDTVVEGTRGAVRLRMEGRSAARGTAPAWLERAATFDLVAIDEGSTEVVLDAPSLAKAVPEQFRQIQLFGGLDGSLSCLDLFGESLCDAVEAKPDSDLYDDHLLDTFGSISRVFGHGVQKIHVLGAERFTLDEPAAGGLKALKRNIPADQRVVVVGKLDALRHSDRMFTLVLDDGRVVRGVVTPSVDLEVLGTLWGKRARVAGLSKFRPSGAVLRIEAESVIEAAGDLSLFTSMPRPLLGDLDMRSLHQPQGPRSGLAAIVGKWPGDESDEEIAELLAELS
ncbi:MAG: hypothetical protein JNL21_00230 [Myxococcales bacterium]|nr:hypothetical protein [Myxococcales bacterium]